MLSAVPLLLTADGGPLSPARRVLGCPDGLQPRCGPRDAVLRVTVEVSGATY